MATEAYTSSTTPDTDVVPDDDAAKVRETVARIVAEETRHAPLVDDSLTDLSWFEMLSILTAIEDELKIRIFADFTTPTVQEVLTPLESVADVVELAERARSADVA